jgi:NitT/TauT family transport system ATP-binding protein
MQQRVAVAQAPIARPRILLMDEAFSALDPQTRADMQDLLLNLWRTTGTTILFVTHNISEGVYLGSRVIALSRNYDGAAGDHAGSRMVLDMDLPKAGSRSFKHSGEFSDLVNRVESAMEPAGIVAAEA